MDPKYPTRKTFDACETPLVQLPVQGDSTPCEKEVNVLPRQSFVLLFALVLVQRGCRKASYKMTDDALLACFLGPIPGLKRVCVRGVIYKNPPWPIGSEEAVLSIRLAAGRRGGDNLRSLIKTDVVRPATASVCLNCSQRECLTDRAGLYPMLSQSSNYLVRDSGISEFEPNCVE